MKKITNEMLSQLLARDLNRLRPTATTGMTVGMTLNIAPEDWELDESKLRGSVIIRSISVKDGVITVDSVPTGTKRGDLLISKS